MIALVLILPGCMGILSSCKTYYIPVESFKEQLAAMDSSKMKEVTVRGPLGEKVRYKTYPVEVIRCVDGKGRPVGIKNSPSIEIRFTDSNNRKTLFYFDRLTLAHDSVTGVRSRILSSIRETIPFNTIKTIEVQDGRKNYHYMD